MTPEELLQDVAYQMSTAAAGESGMIRVCLLEGKIQCITSRDHRRPELVIAAYRADVIHLGLSTAQWHDLKEKLLNIWRQKLQ